MGDMKRTTVIETLKIHELLQQHIEPGEDGFCSYRDGWNDEKIGKAIAPHLGRTHVARIRMATFGQIKASPGEGARMSPAVHRELVAKLETAIKENAVLRQHVASLGQHVASLGQSVSAIETFVKAASGAYIVSAGGARVKLPEWHVLTGKKPAR